MISKIGMYQSPVNYHKSNVSFKSGEKADNLVPQKIETEATTGKKWGVGLASFVINGLGQAINGQWGKGALHFIIGSALALSPMFLLPRGKFGTAIAMCLAALGFDIYSCTDAVKNAKSEVIQMVPADKQDASKEIAEA